MSDLIIAVKAKTNEVPIMSQVKREGHDIKTNTGAIFAPGDKCDEENTNKRHAGAAMFVL